MGGVPGEPRPAPPLTRSPSADPHPVSRLPPSGHLRPGAASVTPELGKTPNPASLAESLSLPFQAWVSKSKTWSEAGHASAVAPGTSWCLVSKGSREPWVSAARGAVGVVFEPLQLLQ